MPSFVYDWKGWRNVKNNITTRYISYSKNFSKFRKKNIIIRGDVTCAFEAVVIHHQEWHSCLIGFILREPKY